MYLPLLSTNAESAMTTTQSRRFMHSTNVPLARGHSRIADDKPVKKNLIEWEPVSFDGIVVYIRKASGF